MTEQVHNSWKIFAWAAGAVATELISFPDLPFWTFEPKMTCTIKLTYKPIGPDGRLIVTASAFSRLRVCPTQSWCHGLLLCRTRRSSNRTTITLARVRGHPTKNLFAKTDFRTNWPTPRVVQIQKSFQLRPDQWFCPWTPLLALPQTPL